MTSKLPNAHPTPAPGRPVAPSGRPGQSGNKAVLVIVHPSWPWESSDDMPTRRRAVYLHRCSLILSRLADQVEMFPTAIVGPFLTSGAGLPKAAVDDLTLIAAQAVAAEEGRLDADLHAAGARLARRFPGARFIVGGFWRDLCCEAVADGILASGADARLDRTLSRCAFPA